MVRRRHTHAFTSTHIHALYQKTQRSCSPSASPPPPFFLWFLSFSSLPCSHLLWSKITGSLSEILKPITLTSHCRHSNPLQSCPSLLHSATSPLSFPPHSMLSSPPHSMLSSTLSKNLSQFSHSLSLDHCSTMWKATLLFLQLVLKQWKQERHIFGLACKGKQCTGGCFTVKTKSNINKHYQNSFCSCLEHRLVCMSMSSDWKSHAYRDVVPSFWLKSFLTEDFGSTVHSEWDLQGLVFATSFLSWWWLSAVFSAAIFGK